ncbi:GIP [Symbiodinium natans]|uniref:GIP protein n=1 Tax=Symbiodinium natans TaxID=878477 RepID=A0A812T809_9DINO|nr:GIP [Symbiodinium natans]
MALLAEAFVGAAPPSLPVARLASKPGPATQVPERGMPSTLAAAAAAFVAGVVAKRRTAVTMQATSTKGKKKSSRSIAKETLARLRSRSPRKTPKSEGARKKMPPSPDPWELDEEGRKIFPWPKSFAEIVQTAEYSTMNLIMEGETRLEVCFPPLPLADLDWNLCDVTETRVVDANIQHAIAFAKLLVKDKRPFPQLNAEEAMKNATEGAALQEPDKIKGHAQCGIVSQIVGRPL